jgi:hypothetical protein
VTRSAERTARLPDLDRNLVAGQARQAVAAHLPAQIRDTAGLLQLDDGLHHLAQQRMGDPADRGVAHEWQLAEDGLDLLRE